MSAAQNFGESGVTSTDLQQALGINQNRVRYILSLVLLAGGYFAAAKFGLSLASVHTNVSPVWPPTGIAIAAVLLLVCREYLLPAADAARVADKTGRHETGAVSRLVLAVVLLVLFIGLAMTFRVGRLGSCERMIRSAAA